MYDEQPLTSVPRILYHGTRPPNLIPIIKNGIQTGGQSQLGNGPSQWGISTTKDFSVVSRSNFGSVVLVLDTNRIPKSKFDFFPINYWGDDSEKEIRVASKKPGKTTIPFSAVKEVIRNSPELPPYEVNELVGLLKVPLRTHWNGKFSAPLKKIEKKKRYSYDRRIGAQPRELRELSVGEVDFLPQVRGIARDFNGFLNSATIKAVRGKIILLLQVAGGAWRDGTPNNDEAISQMLKVLPSSGWKTKSNFGLTEFAKVYS